MHKLGDMEWGCGGKEEKTPALEERSLTSTGHTMGGDVDTLKPRMDYQKKSRIGRHSCICWMMMARINARPDYVNGRLTRESPPRIRQRRVTWLNTGQRETAGSDALSYG